MKITKWIDILQEVTIYINAADVRAPIRETCGTDGEPKAHLNDVLIALSNIGAFLLAITEQIKAMTFGQRMTVETLLTKQSARFHLPLELPAE
jgi:hypothetical protein